MTVMGHPNSENIQRYRVLDKSLGIQEYFSITALGEEGALLAANARQEEIKNMRYLRCLRLNMDMNKIFTEGQHSVKGLSKYYRKDRGTNILVIQVTVNGVQKKAEIGLNNKTFLEAYSKAQQKICELHGVVLDYEIRQIFKAVSYLYK